MLKPTTRQCPQARHPVLISPPPVPCSQSPRPRACWAGCRRGLGQQGARAGRGAASRPPGRRSRRRRPRGRRTAAVPSGRMSSGARAPAGSPRGRCGTPGPPAPPPPARRAASVPQGQRPQGTGTGVRPARGQGAGWQCPPLAHLAQRAELHRDLPEEEVDVGAVGQRLDEVGLCGRGGMGPSAPVPPHGAAPFCAPSPTLQPAGAVLEGAQWGAAGAQAPVDDCVARLEVSHGGRVEAPIWGRGDRDSGVSPIPALPHRHPATPAPTSKEGDVALPGVEGAPCLPAQLLALLQQAARLQAPCSEPRRCSPPPPAPPLRRGSCGDPSPSNGAPRPVPVSGPPPRSCGRRG